MEKGLADNGGLSYNGIILIYVRLSHSILLGCLGVDFFFFFNLFSFFLFFSLFHLLLSLANTPPIFFFSFSLSLLGANNRAYTVCLEKKNNVHVTRFFFFFVSGTLGAALGHFHNANLIFHLATQRLMMWEQAERKKKKSRKKNGMPGGVAAEWLE